MFWILSCGHVIEIPPYISFFTLIDEDCWECYTNALNKL